MYFLVSFNVLRHKVPVFQLTVMVYAAVRPFVQPTNLKTVKHVVEDLLLVSHPMKSVITENDVVDFSTNSWEVYGTPFYKREILDLTVRLFGQLNSFLVRIDTNNLSFGSYQLS